MGTFGKSKPEMPVSSLCAYEGLLKAPQKHLH